MNNNNPQEDDLNQKVVGNGVSGEDDNSGQTDDQEPDPNSDPNKPTDQTNDQPKELIQDQIPDELKDALKDILRVCELEDQSIREVYLRTWTKLQYYFDNLIATFYDEQSGQIREPNLADFDGEDAPRLMPVYRAYAESIIAAITTTVPGIVFFPDDAENPLDLETAETYSNIVALIEKHVKAPLLLMRLATILFNQGTAFGYNYYKTDKSFGYHHVPTFSTIAVDSFDLTCPRCNYDLGISDEKPTEPMKCPQCQQSQVPQSQPNPQQQEIQSGVEQIDKGRILIDLFDPRFVKVSFFARSQTDIGYLLLSFDQSVSLLRSVFDDDSITVNSIDTKFDGWARYATNYFGQIPNQTAVVKCLWIRPWQFHCLGDEKADVIQQLIAQYPSGCYALFINGEVYTAVDEDLDDHWTISENPLSPYIHGEPAGKNLADVQDIIVEVDDLELQTMEHGIPETFVLPQTVDLDQYTTVAARPGNLVPTKGAEPGQPLGSSFFQTKTSTLSAEIETYKQSLLQRAQFVTGAFPSVYGGTNDGGGSTAAEYRMSQAQALKRLGISWKIICEFWCNISSRAANEFVMMLENDERHVIKQGSSFKNINIRKDSLKGKIARAEAEYSDQLPVTWEQTQDLLMRILALKDPNLEAVLFNPNNAEFLKKAGGLTTLSIPGERDRSKQLQEFVDLSNAQPLTGMNGQPESSVQPDVMDNHKVHSEVLQELLVGPKGMKLKKENPPAFQNCILHWQAHMLQMQIAMGSMAPPQQGQVKNPAPPTQFSQPNHNTPQPPQNNAQQPQSQGAI